MRVRPNGPLLSRSPSRDGMFESPSQRSRPSLEGRVPFWEGLECDKTLMYRELIVGTDSSCSVEAVEVDGTDDGTDSPEEAAMGKRDGCRCGRCTTPECCVYATCDGCRQIGEPELQRDASRNILRNVFGEVRMEWPKGTRARCHECALTPEEMVANRKVVGERRAAHAIVAERYRAKIGMPVGKRGRRMRSEDWSEADKAEIRALLDAPCPVKTTADEWEGL
jgi:hypothetical protein